MLKQLSLAAGLSAAAFAAQAEQPQADYNWYFDPMLMYTVTDSDRGANIDDGTGGRFIFGRNLSDQLAVELGLVGEKLDNTAGADIARRAATIDLRYTFGDSALRPYVLGGVGAVRFDGAGSKETEALINLGLGALWQFHKSGASVRAEVRAKSTEETIAGSKEDLLDYDVGLGLHIPLSSKKDTATLVAVAPIAVAPADSDGDGVSDAKDRCPRTIPSVRVDDRGCEVADKITLEGIQFARNSAELTLAGSELERALRVMQKYPELRIMIAGHTDSRLSEAYNQKLSERRAASVKKWLTQAGISPNRMLTVGAGETKPIADNSTDAGRAKNRRVELHVLR